MQTSHDHCRRSHRATDRSSARDEDHLRDRRRRPRGVAARPRRDRPHPPECRRHRGLRAALQRDAALASIHGTIRFMTDMADVIVVGAGLAGLAAALTAREQGLSVLVLECASEDERGGNSRFSNGAMRAVYDGIADLEKLVDEIGSNERARTDFGQYSREQYFDDMGRVTQYRADPVLTDLLVENSRDSMLWLRKNGVRFMPLYQWHERRPDGTIRFSGGSALETYDGGEGLSNALFAAAGTAGIRVAYKTRA